MSYKNCCTAQEEIRKKCPLGMVGYEECVKSYQLSTNKAEVERNCTHHASTCYMDGTSKPLYACLSDGASVAQTCGGNYVFGIPSKLVR